MDTLGIAKIYYLLVKSEKSNRTMQQVPTHLRSEVQALLNADTDSGEPIAAT